MAETKRGSDPLTRDPPLVRVKMTCQGPHVLTDDEQSDDGREEPQPFACVAEVDSPSRDILPISTGNARDRQGVLILPMQSAQIAWHLRMPSCPQTWIYKIGRFIISHAGTAGGAADWIVNDIKISGLSQFVQSGNVSGAMFAANALSDPNEVEKFVRFKPVQITKDDVVVVVTYIGLNEKGCPFFGALVGTAVDNARWPWAARST